MDPLSITVAITGLSATIGTVTKHIKQLVKAPAHVKKLSKNLQHFSYELQIISSQLRHPEISRHLPQEHIRSVLAEAHESVKELNLRLRKVVSEDGKERQIKRLAWIRHENKCQELQVLLALSLEKLTRLKDLVMLEIILQVASGGDPDISRLCITETSASRASLPSAPDLDPDDTSESDGRRSSSTTLIPQESSQVQELSVSAEDTVPQVGHQVRCGHCDCQCHTAKFNQFRRQSEGQSSIIYSNSIRRCTNFGCCARRRRSEGMVPISPKWLKDTGLFSFRTRKIRPEKSLPVRVIISEGSDAVRYAKSGNLEGLKRMITQGVPVTRLTTSDGWSLLHTASWNGQFGIVNFLLEQSADVNAKEDGNRKPADLARVRALRVGATELQREIAGRFPGAEDFKDDFELTPIHVAVLGLYDHEDKVCPDLSSILDFIDEAENAPRNTDWRKFQVVERKKSPLFADIIKIYTEKLRDIERTGTNGIPLIDKADEIHGWTPFLWATLTGRREAMETLIDSGADPFTISERKRNALHLAAESRIPEVMSYVLDRPSFQGHWYDINQGDCWEETPLHIAAAGSSGCVRLLLAHGANRFAAQETNQVPLHYASLASDATEKLRIVDLLSADEGSHINSVDDEGRTPIFELLDSLPCVELLIRRGADLSICDKNSKSLHHYAAAENRVEALRMLLKHSTSQFATSLDKNANTPLALAFEHHSAACAILLIERDALGDFHGKEGWSLVHHAAVWGDADVLEAALKHSTFIRGAKTPKQESAADLAKSCGKWEGRVKQLLKEYDSRGRVANPTKCVELP